MTSTYLFKSKNNKIDIDYHVFNDVKYIKDLKIIIKNIDINKCIFADTDYYIYEKLDDKIVRREKIINKGAEIYVQEFYKLNKKNTYLNTNNDDNIFNLFNFIRSEYRYLKKNMKYICINSNFFNYDFCRKYYFKKKILYYDDICLFKPTNVIPQENLIIYPELFSNKKDISISDYLITYNVIFSFIKKDKKFKVSDLFIE